MPHMGNQQSRQQAIACSQHQTPNEPARLRAVCLFSAPTEAPFARPAKKTSAFRRGRTRRTGRGTIPPQYSPVKFLGRESRSFAMAVFYAEGVPAISRRCCCRNTAGRPSQPQPRQIFGSPRFPYAEGVPAISRRCCCRNAAATPPGAGQ
jgi:hypothetical protein